MRTRIVATAVLLALAACGVKQELHPAEGHGLPVKPAMATKQPTPANLLAAPTIARPERVTEVLTRSDKRKPDRFDLPPPD